MLRRWLVAVVVLAWGVAACADDPGRELSTETSQSDGSTVESTTTTRGGAPSADESVVAQVVVAYEGVLGGWDGSRWVRAGPDVDLSLVGGELYRMVRLGDPVEEVEGPAPSQSCELNDVPEVDLRWGDTAYPNAGPVRPTTTEHRPVKLSDLWVSQTANRPSRKPCALTLTATARTKS